MKETLLKSLPLLLFLLIWQLWTGSTPRLQFLFASPLLVLNVALEELATEAFWNDIYVTTLEALLGLVLGVLSGSLVGLGLWANPLIARISKPYVVLLGSVPIFAIAPILIMWFGTGLASKVIMAAFSVFFVSLSQAYDGAQFCSSSYGHYARSLGAGRRKTLKYIIIPGAMRWVTAGVKVSIGLALVGAFIGEFVSSQAGLGHYILKAGSLYDMPRVLFGVIVISLLALAMTAAVWWLEKLKPNLFSDNLHH